MQKIFRLKISLKSYVSLGKEYDFPEPGIVKCHNVNCNKMVEYKKHGFYERYVIDFTYSGYILIRRYKCTNCNSTISFLPDVCIPKITYSAEVVFEFLFKYLKLLKNNLEIIQIETLRFYLKRFGKNSKLISQGIREIIPNARLPDNALRLDEIRKSVLSTIFMAPCSIKEFCRLFYENNGKTLLTKPLNLF